MALAREYPVKFSEALRPDHIHLRQTETDPLSARDRLLASLLHDPRVTDAARFETAVLNRAAEPLFEGDSGIWICHGRTDAVSSLILGISCHSPGLVFPEGSVPLLIVAGIPDASNQHYLQLIGSLVRIFRTPDSLALLLASPTPSDLIETLDDFRNVV